MPGNRTHPESSVSSSPLTRPFQTSTRRSSLRGNVLYSSFFCLMVLTSLRRIATTAAFSRPLWATRHVIGSYDSTGTRLLSSFQQDGYGRRIRRRGDNDDADEDGWGGPPPSSSRRGSQPSRERSQGRGSGGGGWMDDDDDGSGAPAPRRTSRGGGWDEDAGDDGWDSNYTPRPRSSRGDGNRSRGNSFSRDGNRRGGGGDEGRGGGGDRNRYNQPFRRDGRERGGGRFNSNRNSNANGKQSTSRAINMNALEGAGFVHLYGLASILNALDANRRDLTTVHEKSIDSFYDDADDDDDEEEESSGPQEREPPKPQAQFRPYLFVQEQRSSNRRGQKASDADKVMALAEERGVPIAEVDKGILNTLSGNRPHQGFVLRCGKLFFESLSRVPVPDGSDEMPSLWLVLDEVVDPQNLGALLRSAHFLGQRNMGVLVCSKNSAPPTPVVSAASAGALELATVYSTSNLPRTLSQAKEDGFRIIGASSSVPSTGGSTDADGEVTAPPPLYNLQELPVGSGDTRPVLLVLGSEGHGLRTLVAKACTEFVRIPAGMGSSSEGTSDDNVGVDSLNVSVTGGILLWQLLSAQK